MLEASAERTARGCATIILHVISCAIQALVLKVFVTVYY